MNRNGRLDPDFGKAGIATFEVQSGYRGFSRVLPDQSFISLGSTTPIDSIAVLKHNKNGIRDEAFGLVILTLVSGVDFSLSNALIQNDGRVVIIGALDSGNKALFARLQPDGSLDSTFGTSELGLTIIEMPEHHRIENSRRRSGLIARNDNSIVAALELDVGDSFDRSGVLISLSRDGVPEAGFGHLGAAYSDGLSSFQSVVAQNDGKVLVTGIREKGGLVARYTRNGAPDLDYDRFNKGYVLVDGTGGMHVELFAAEQKEDRTLAAGYIFKGNMGNPLGSLALIARLDSNGELDPYFNNGTVVEAGKFHARGVATLADKKILIWLHGVGSSAGALLMLDHAGTPDESFGNDGLLHLEFDSGIVQVGFQLLDDGNAMVCGASYDGRMGVIARILTH